jgi:hypothetical protein
MLNKDRDQGPGSSAFKTRQIADPGSLAISQRPARKVGRSSFDVTRLAEQAFRRTRDPYQRLQIGMIRDRYAPNETDELDTLAAQSKEAGTPPQGGYLGNTSSAGTNAVTNSFMGNKNPALSGFFGMAKAPFRVLGGLFNNSNQNR